MAREPLGTDQINDALQSLTGWTHDDNELRKTFEFKNFRAAVSFIVRLSFEAEERDHHPRLTNVYNKVDVALTTHDAGNKVTQRDVELAQAIEHLSWV